MESEATAIALIACAAFGYGFFLGHWAGRREARQDRKLATHFLRASRNLLRRHGYPIDRIDIEREP